MPIESDLPEPRRRRGRRDNGLDASSYVEVRDVDPRVGEDLLEALRDVGVAAYLEPKTTNDQYLRATSLPSPPMDRLWVDREARERAAEILDQPDLEHSPAVAQSGHQGARTEGSRSDRLDLDNADVDARFAELIAGFGAASDVPDTATKAKTVEDDTDESDTDTDEAELESEDEDETDDSSDQGAQTNPAQDGVIWRGPTGGLGPAAHDPAEHYHPPEPPPVRIPSVQAQLGILVILLGASLLFFPSLLGLGANISLTLGVLGIAGGTWLLIGRLRRTPLDEDDDGAVV